MPRIRVKPDAERTAEERAADAARLQEMFAAQQPPGARYTDRAFLEDRHNGKQFEGQPKIGDLYRKRAKRAGVSTVGKFYHAGIARYPGDPRAWISDTGDLLRVCKKRGLSVTGAVEYQAPPQPPPPSKPLSNKIVNRLVNTRLWQDPDLCARVHEKPAKLAELRAEVVEKHSLKRKPKKLSLDV